MTFRPFLLALAALLTLETSESYAQQACDFEKDCFGILGRSSSCLRDAIERYQQTIDNSTIDVKIAQLQDRVSAIDSWAEKAKDKITDEIMILYRIRSGVTPEVARSEMQRMNDRLAKMDQTLTQMMERFDFREETLAKQRIVRAQQCLPRAQQALEKR